MSVLLLLGAVFAIAAAGPVSQATIKDMIGRALNQEVATVHVYNAFDAGQRILCNNNNIIIIIMVCVKHDCMWKSNSAIDMFAFNNYFYSYLHAAVLIFPSIATFYN